MSALDDLKAAINEVLGDLSFLVAAHKTDVDALATHPAVVAAAATDAELQALVAQVKAAHDATTVAIANAQASVSPPAAPLAPADPAAPVA